MEKAFVNAGRSDKLHISGFHSLLSVASYYAQIVDSNVITLGITKDQIDAIPNTKEVLTAFESVVRLLNPLAGEFSINVHLAEMTKAEIVKLGCSLGVPFELTWSCLNAGEQPCRECIQCKTRQAAFQEAGVVDPATEE